MAEYFQKPQNPLKQIDKTTGDIYYVYPLTQSDQVIMDDGSRLNASMSALETDINVLETDKQDQHKAVTVTLSASGWNDSSQTVSVSGATATNTIMVSSSPENLSAYNEAGIYCSAQGSGNLTFNCETTPSTDVNANIMILT